MLIKEEEKEKDHLPCIYNLGTQIFFSFYNLKKIQENKKIVLEIYFMAYGFQIYL